MTLIWQYLTDLWYWILGFHWYIPLYWLLAFYLLVWLVALCLCPMLKKAFKKSPVERSVYYAWAIGCALHLALFVYWASDNILPAWYGVPAVVLAIISPWDRLYAVLRILPFVLMFLGDVALTWYFCVLASRKSAVV